MTIVAQDVADTLYIINDTVVYQWMDTLKLHEMDDAVSYDNYLLNLVAQQGEQIRVRDSLYKDSLLADLYRRDSLLTRELQTIKDSIRLLRADEIAQQDYEDSIANIARQMDSIALLAENMGELKGWEFPRGLVKDPEQDMKDLAVYYRRLKSHWMPSADVMLQFTQNYISPNWYKGGTGNLTVLAIAKGRINYRKDKITWENTGEWRTGVGTTSGDTLRKINVTDDLFRIYSKFGYQVLTKLYVSSSVDFQTNLWNVWKSNERTVKTTFMTPIRFNWTLGVDYKPIKHMSLLVSPLAYKMVYAYRGDESGKVNVNNYGIESGEHILNEVGSSLRFQYKWQPLREILLETDFYFFTNYKRVEIDWEINCDFIITRFLTARLMLHPRYDNTVIMTGDERAKIQFKELLSIGFAHKFK